MYSDYRHELGKIKDFLSDVPLLLLVYCIFVPIFAVILFFIYPVVVEIFSVVGILSDLFFKWYISLSLPSNISGIAKYLVGFTIGTTLLSIYIFIGFHKGKSMKKVNQTKLIFPAALTIASLRWLPLTELSSLSSLNLAVESALFALPFLLFVYFVGYKTDKSQSELPEAQTTLREAKYNQWKRNSRYLLRKRDFIAYLKQRIRIYLLKKNLMDWIKRSPDILAARVIYQEKNEIFSYIYLTLILAASTYLIEKFVLVSLSNIVKPLIILYVVLFLICMAIWPKLLNYLEKSYEDVEEIAKEVSES